MSQDQVVAAAASLDKQRKAKTSAKKGERAGHHVDVIDRLDYSAVGPASTCTKTPFNPLTTNPNHVALGLRILAFP